MDNDWLDAGRDAHRRLREIERRAREVGVDLPVSQLMVLADVVERSRTTKSLAGRHGVSRSTVTAALASLEGRGLVSRSASPEDRRVVVVSATAAGVALVEPLVRDGGGQVRPSLPPLRRTTGSSLPSGVRDPNRLLRGLRLALA